MESIDSIETQAYGTSKDLVSDKEQIKWNTNNTKMINFDNATKENIKNITQTGHKSLIILTEY